LTEEREQQMRSFPAAKKFMIIQSHKQMAQEKEVSPTEDPLSFITLLKDPVLSLDEIKKIRVQLTAVPMSWLRSFLSKGGLSACCELLVTKHRKLK
jgi:hypothetical protein